MYETERLLLRQWTDDDLQSFIKINQDQTVMKYYPSTLSVSDTINMVARIKNKFKTNGFGLYAVVLKETQQFIGYIGLNTPDFQAYFTPCVEIGWRLAKEYWGQGLAVEGAKKCLELGFNQFNLNEIVSFTAKINTQSERVMQKLGMAYEVDGDFHHPKLPREHRLSLHVLYRISYYPV